MILGPDPRPQPTKIIPQTGQPPHRLDHQPRHPPRHTHRTDYSQIPQRSPRGRRGSSRGIGLGPPPSLREEDRAAKRIDGEVGGSR